MTNIAIENGPFTDDVPIQTSIYSGFSIAMLNNQMVYPLIDSFPIKTSIYKGTSHCQVWLPKGNQNWPEDS